MCWILYCVLGIEKRLKPRPGPSGALVVGGERGRLNTDTGPGRPGGGMCLGEEGAVRRGDGHWLLEQVPRGHCDCLCVHCAGATAHTHFTAEGTEARQSAEPLS